MIVNCITVLYNIRKFIAIYLFIFFFLSSILEVEINRTK